MARLLKASHGTDAGHVACGVGRRFSGGELRRPITGGQATDHREGPEGGQHTRYRAGAARESDHDLERTKNKIPDIQQVHQAVLQRLHLEQVEVEIYRVEELAQRRGLTSEREERWSDVGKQTEPRWLWHALEHYSRPVLAYGFGRRKDEVCLQLQDL